MSQERRERSIDMIVSHRMPRCRAAPRCVAAVFRNMPHHASQWDIANCARSQICIRREKWRND